MFGPRESNEEELTGWIDGDPINATEVLLPQGEAHVAAKVLCHHIGDNGQVYRKYSSNPMLNSILYDIEFVDCNIKQYSANIIAQNMYDQLNGHSKVVLDCIIDHRKDE
eukprot:15362235-Ditylum_brightwellii.AAC.1